MSASARRTCRHNNALPTLRSAIPESGTISGGGKRIDVPISSRVIVNIADAALDSVLAGFGYSQLTSYQAMDAILSGRLQRVLSEFEQPAVPISVLHVDVHNATAKVRSFVDFIVDGLRSVNTVNLDSSFKRARL